MRADRLLHIAAVLRQGGRHTAAQLARRLEVSERTILRDIEALSAAGVPVYSERGPGGGFCVLDNYREPVRTLTDAEARALFIATRSGIVDALGLGDQLLSALGKVGTGAAAATGRSATALADRIVVDDRSWSSEPEPTPHLDALAGAVFADRRLRITYHPTATGRAGQRTVDPWGLLLSAVTWYLIGSHRGRVRTYRVSRISSVRVLPQRFIRPEGLDLTAVWHRKRAEFAAFEGIPVVVRVAREHAPILAQTLAMSAAGPLSWQDEGDWVISFDTKSLRGTAAALVGFGDLVRIVEPAELRALVVQVARQAVAHHADPGQHAGPVRRPGPRVRREG